MRKIIKFLEKKTMDYLKNGTGKQYATAATILAILFIQGIFLAMLSHVTDMYLWIKISSYIMMALSLSGILFLFVYWNKYRAMEYGVIIV